MAFPIENFLSPNLTNMLITLVIPFLIFFTILLVVLKRTRIFGSSNFVYILIALGLTIMIYAVNPGNIFQFLASYLFQIGVAGTIIALGGVIMIIFFTLIRKGYSIAEKIGKDDAKKLEDLKKREEKLLKEYYSGGVFGSSTSKRMKIQEELERIKNEERYFLAKLKKLR